MEQDITQLFERYLKGECNAEEIAHLYAYFGLEANESLLKDRIARVLDSNEDTPRALRYQARQVADRARGRLQAQLAFEPMPVSGHSRRLVKWIPYAAAVAILFVAGWWIAGNRWSVNKDGVVISAEDILPAGNRATLTLADGRTIDLSEAQSGIVVSDGISYSDGSTLFDDQLLATQAQTLTAPRGGTYQLTLPDGSKVWLNSASTIKYPGRFDDNERIVELEGEAYFSVAKIRKKGNGQSIPFKVLSAGQIVEVLGTEFNISSYKDESKVKTTLVEGSVRVVATAGASASLVLAPGEQSIISDDGALNKAAANLKKELAWKSGIFYFDETSFAELMRQVSRWYDIDIRYAGDVPQASFSGVMSRHVSLKTLLEFLSESTAQFTLANRTLTIQAKTH